MNKLPKKHIRKRRIAIFIDAANFEISLKLAGLKVEYQTLVEHFSGKGAIIAARYYTPDFGSAGQNRFFTFIKRQGFKIVTKKVKRIKSRPKNRGKANFDVEIAFDAAVRLDGFDQIVLFSGDSDFVYLLAELQKRGISTMIISSYNRTARELRKQADVFIELKDCNFIKKKLPFGSAHNNLSTASKIYRKKKKKSRA